MFKFLYYHRTMRVSSLIKRILISEKYSFSQLSGIKTKFEILFKFLYYHRTMRVNSLIKKILISEKYSFSQLSGVKMRSPLNFSIINACISSLIKKHWFLEIFFLSTVRNQNERLLLSERSSLNYHKTMCKIYILQYRFPSLTNHKRNFSN